MCGAPALRLVGQSGYHIVGVAATPARYLAPLSGYNPPKNAPKNAPFGAFGRVASQLAGYVSGWGRGYPHYMISTLSNEPKRGGATRLRPEIHFSPGDLGNASLSNLLSFSRSSSSISSLLPSFSPSSPPPLSMCGLHRALRRAERSHDHRLAGHALHNEHDCCMFRMLSHLPRF